MYVSTLQQLRALKTMRHIDIYVSNRWAKRGIYHMENYNEDNDRKLALDLDATNKPWGVEEKR
jgi:hypothetical protein